MQNESKEYLPIFSCKRVGKKKKKQRQNILLSSHHSEFQKCSPTALFWMGNFSKQETSRIPLLLKSHLLLEGILGSKFFSQL